MISPEKAQRRAQRCVCKMCGGPVEARIVIYNHYGGSGTELYCPKCQRIEYGTEPEIYRIAEQFVDSVEFDYFTDMEEGARHDQLNISKVCELLGWVLKKTGALDASGIKAEAKDWLLLKQ